MKRFVLAVCLAGVVAGLSMMSSASPPPPPPPGPDVPPVEDLPDAFPTPAQREGWVRLGDMPGVNVRDPDKAWTTPAVVEVVRLMGQAAEELGGTLQVAGVSGPVRGAENPPHVSHRWGRDLDIAYTFAGYPTPPDVPVDPRVVSTLQAVAQYIERVGVNAVRADAFAGSGLTVSQWAGHVGHLHLRLLQSLTVEP